MEDATTESNIAESITVVTRTDYTSSGGGEEITLDIGDSLDTNTVLYSTSDTTNADLLLSSGSREVARFERAQNDLSNFKKRIDANTEEQREHADLIVDLQRKVEEYRRHIAAIENQVAARKTDENLVFNIKDVSETWMPDLKIIGTDLESAALLEEERRRNNELCMQIAQQQMEIQRLRQQFEANMHDKDKAYQTRERNLVQYLNDEQQKMMNLWAELQELRLQFADYREQTERDLENQRNEFARVTRNIGGAVRRLSITSIGAEGGSIQDNDLIEALKKFRDLQVSSTTGTSTDEYNTLMKKYEESIERIVELETRGDGSAGKASALEAELKRTKQKLADSQEALRKLYDMAKEADTKSGLKKRSRSLSPGKRFFSYSHIAPTEVVRNMRYVLRNRDNELQQLQRNFKNAELQVRYCSLAKNIFSSNFDFALFLWDPSAKWKISWRSAKKDIIVAVALKRRWNTGYRHAQQTSYPDSVTMRFGSTSCLCIIDQTDVDGAHKALEDAEAQKNLIEDEYKSRIAELTRRMGIIQDENKKLMSDLAMVKDKHRNLEIEHNTTLRKINEKDVAIQNLEELKADLLKDLENQRTRFDAVTSELDNLQTNLDSKTKASMVVEMTIKEIKLQRDNISKEKEDLSKRLVELSRRLAIEIKKREDLSRTEQHNLSEIARLKEQIADYDNQVMTLRQHNEEQDTRLKTSIAKIATLENSLASAQTEIAKLIELNNKLQNDKQDIMNAKQRADVELDALKGKLRKLEQEIEKLKLENGALHDEEHKTQIAYKEETNKVHQLVMELKEARTEINGLERKLADLTHDNQLRLENALHRAPSDKVDSYEITEITETKVKQLDDRHRLDLQKIENERDDLAGRLHLLEDELIEKKHTVDAQQTEIADLKSRYEAEIEKLNAKLKGLVAKHQNELEDQHDQHSYEMEALKAEESELRNKITLLEKNLEDAQNEKNILEKQIEEWEEKCDTLHKEVQNIRDQHENMRADAEKEIQKWKTELYTAEMELKNLEATNETLRSQLAVANERANSLNKTVSDQAVKIRDLSTQVRRHEEELADAKATIASHEADLEDTTGRLKATEEQYATLEHENNKIVGELDALKRKVDVLNSGNASNENEIERLKKKIAQLTSLNKEHMSEIEKLRNESDEMERGYREKTKLADQLNETIKMLESKVERMHHELQNLNDKLVASESEKSALYAQAKKMEQELQFGNDLIVRKTNEFNVALDDLANAHRSAEDGRVNALQEIEAKKFEIADLQSRLDNAEQRLGALQQEYLNVDNEREMLNDSLRRFQHVISRAVIPEAGSPIDIHTIDVHVQKLITRNEKLERERNQFRDSLGRLQRKTSDSQIAVNKHENICKTIEEKLIDIEEEKRSLELKLASAKELLRSQEDALKQRDQDRHTMKQKIVTYELETRGKDAQIRHLNELVKTLRTDLENAQNDNRVLRDREEQWDAAKVLLESKIRDQDGDAQKVNMLVTTFETERQNLNDSLKKLSSQLLNSEAKNADMKDNVERLKRDLAKAEKIEVDLRRSLEEQTRIARDCQQLRDQLCIAQNDLSNASNRKQQLEAELLSARCELRDNKQNLRDANIHITDLDRQLQNALNDKSRLNDRITELEKVISASNSKESELRQKLLAADSEMKAAQNELEDLRRRIAQFDEYKRTASEKVEETKKMRITLTKKIEIVISASNSKESELRQKLLAADSEMKAAQNELEDLRRRIAQFDEYKRTASEKVEETKKMRITLTKKIEILENEKRTAESLINETALQREAIERSLSALERENKELYRNCSRLQQQIAQLEMDNGSRFIALTNKQKEEHERFVKAVKAEKAQVERIVENRDRMQKTRIKQLENQLNIVREQLNNERLKRRDESNRMFISDMGKVGGSVFGSMSTGAMSAGANVYPQCGAFDYLIGSGGKFASQFMTPPPIRSLSPIRDIYQPLSSTITLEEPSSSANLSQMMAAEKVKLDSVEQEVGDAQNDMKTTTIVVHMKGTKIENESANHE
ncbi:Spindle- and centromere-associated protein [Toxocara canis]|uniref:Spindle-and centromere-associated protein n=1 Tax=Toxocara canis TaxID=6265 RepID=A0A0B2VAU5_TOXCA|nr:Spindle- and centromere-associated protein [Toxocara canis]